MKFDIKALLKFIVFVGIGLLIFYLLYKNFEGSYLEDCKLKGIPEAECSLIDKIITDFKSVKIFWILAVLVAYMLSNIIRALRWKQLLQPMGYNPKLYTTVGSLMIGYFTNLAFPRIGEFIKIGILTKYENIPFEKVMGTVFLDRILDVISLLVVISLAMLLAFGTFRDYFSAHFVAPSTSTLTIVALLGVIGLIGLYFVNRTLQSGNFNNPILLKVKNLWQGFKEGISSLKDVENIPLLLAYTAGIWILYYLMTYLCFFAFAPTAHLGMIAGLVVFVFGTLGMVFPSPGGMGSYHLLISQALIIYGINGADAFSFSNILFFAVTLFANVIFGLIFFVTLPLLNKQPTLA